MHNDSHRGSFQVTKFLINPRRVEDCLVCSSCVPIHSWVWWWLQSCCECLVQQRIWRDVVEWERQERIVGSRKQFKLATWMYSIAETFQDVMNEPIFSWKDVKFRVDLFRWLRQHIDVAEWPRIFEASQIAVANNVSLPLLSMLRRADLPLKHRLLHGFNLLLFFVLIFVTRTCAYEEICNSKRSIIATYRVCRLTRSIETQGSLATACRHLASRDCCSKCSKLP